VGAWIRNTLKLDKNANREEALMDIYRVMRPGEPPTIEAAERCSIMLFFDPERYDLSAVGRVKMNMRLDLDAEDTVRVCAAKTSSRFCKTLVDLRDGGRDRRHRPPRQPPRALGRRVDGEPVPRRSAAHGARDQGAHELGRYRHGDAAGPDQREAGCGRRARVLRLLAAVAVHGPDQPAVEITHKRRLSALGPGGLTRERAGFEVRDVHPTHYGRICPIETPEGPNIGLINSLATFARVNKYGFIESPYRKVVDGKGDRSGRLPVGGGRDAPLHCAGQR
jgi:DNA-directed RNA polymerase subunit beta